MRLALFQPAIPQNVGACIRLSACFGAELHVIEPTGFPFDDRAMKRAALDYGPLSHMTRHADWAAFQASRRPGRLILFTTRGAVPLNEFVFRPDDVLLFGSETSGVPDKVHAEADARVVVPIRPETRSLNVSVTAGIGLWEIVRQLQAQ
jgi:tRNA (cytidine/uridine-2'-O-)-methyltransferase